MQKKFQLNEAEFRYFKTIKSGKRMNATEIDVPDLVLDHYMGKCTESLFDGSHILNNREQKSQSYD